jgi:hypothetical protein
VDTQAGPDPPHWIYLGSHEGLKAWNRGDAPFADPEALAKDELRRSILSKLPAFTLSTATGVDVTADAGARIEDRAGAIIGAWVRLLRVIAVATRGALLSFHAHGFSLGCHTHPPCAALASDASGQ